MRVIKLGSSVLRSPQDLPQAVHRVYRSVRAGERVVAVVSALGDTTDRLAAQAVELGSDPWGTARLLATGELESVALLELAMKRAGLDAIGLGAEVLRATGEPLDAQPVEVGAALGEALERHAVVVVPGFVALDERGRTVTLGRGGSDLSALFLAWRLGGSCELVKDVDGLYERDPRLGAARRFAACSFEDALELDGGVVQHKAVRFARRVGLPFAVGETRVGVRSVFGPPASVRRRRVALLGLGTVGRGVWHRLHASPDRFDVVGVAVRALGRREGIPGLTTDAAGLVAGDCDVVVELIGGVDEALSLVRAALASGKDVVTANKRLLAENGDALRALAARTGARLLDSASVGGAVPALEAAGREDVLAIAGVVNGTCNCVLEQLEAGRTLDQAVSEAQRLGFAEADPTLDLDGTDAADKLILLAERAWGVRPRVQREGLESVEPERVREAWRRGRRLRLVASATPQGARVGLQELAADHPLAGLRGEENRVLLTTPAGVVQLTGKGAGRWPTTEAVIADCWELT